MSVRIIIIASVCILSVAVGLVGNLLIVIARIFKQLQRRNTSAYSFLICQLAIADFLFAFTIIFDIHVLINDGKWIFGSGLCKFIKTLQSTSVSTTVGFLTLMSYERYLGLSNPLKPRWSIRKTSFIVVVIWLYILATFIPVMIAADVKDGQCYEVHHPSEDFRKAYTMFLFVTNFVFPLLTIIVFHTLIVIVTRKHLASMRNNRHRGNSELDSSSSSPAIELKNGVKSKLVSISDYSKTQIQKLILNKEPGSKKSILVYFKCFSKNKERHEVKSPNSSSPFTMSIRQRLSRRIRSPKFSEDHKLVKMLVAVTLCFALMTLPTQVWYIWYDFGNGAKDTKTQLQILEIFASLAYMHCCANCIIYSAMDQRFRKDVKSMFLHICGMEDKNKFAFKRNRNLTMLSGFSKKSTSSLKLSNIETKDVRSPTPNIMEKETVI